MTIRKMERQAGSGDNMSIPVGATVMPDGRAIVIGPSSDMSDSDSIFPRTIVMLK
jgi:hypothetical protein